jgi:serine/threonine protein kinase
MNFFNFTGNTKKSNLIFCGTYGCVIRPAYLCESKTFSKNNNIVSKIFLTEKDWKDEIDINLKVIKYDPDNLFTIKIINYCDFIVNSDFKNSINLNEDTKTFLNKITISQKCYQIVYEYGGIDLYSLLTEKKHIDKISNLNVIVFLKSFINIIKGVNLLNSKNLYHSDIKPDNILYNIENNKFNLIDFGLMTDINNIYDINSIKNFEDTTFAYYPNEYNILLYITKNSLSEIKIINTPLNINLLFNDYLIKNFNIIKDKYKLKNIHLDKLELLIDEIRKKKENYQEITKIYDNFIKKYKKDKDLLNKILLNNEYYFLNDDNIITLANNHILSNNINNLCSTSTNIKSKIDVYMLGLTLLFIIIELFLNFNESNGIFNIPIDIYPLILNMININPCDRYSITEALNNYEKLFP